MGVTIRRTNNIPRLKQLLQRLDKKEIQVGVFGNDSNVDHENINIVTLARVHEYGMTITPKHAKYLTVPVHPAAKGKRAGDFPDLVFIPNKAKDGGRLVRKRGNDMETIFVCVESVTIPERSFIRSGFDKNVDKITTKIETLLDGVISFGINPDVFLDMIGLEFAGLIQKELKKLKSPANAPATKRVKGSSNPLIDTGRLVGAISHKVE